MNPTTDPFIHHGTYSNVSSAPLKENSQRKDSGSETTRAQQEQPRKDSPANSDSISPANPPQVPPHLGNQMFDGSKGIPTVRVGRNVPVPRITPTVRAGIVRSSDINRNTPNATNQDFDQTHFNPLPFDSVSTLIVDSTTTSPANVSITTSLPEEADKVKQSYSGPINTDVINRALRIYQQKLLNPELDKPSKDTLREKITTLLCITTEEGPSQTVVNEILNNAKRDDKITYIKTFIAKKYANNNPSKEALYGFFNWAVEKRTILPGTGKLLDARSKKTKLMDILLYWAVEKSHIAIVEVIIKAIQQHASNPPSQQGILRALELAKTNPNIASLLEQVKPVEDDDGDVVVFHSYRQPT